MNFKTDPYDFRDVLEQRILGRCPKSTLTKAQQEFVQGVTLPGYLAISMLMSETAADENEVLEKITINKSELQKCLKEAARLGILRMDPQNRRKF